MSEWRASGKCRKGGTFSVRRNNDAPACNEEKNVVVLVTPFFLTGWTPRRRVGRLPASPAHDGRSHPRRNQSSPRHNARTHPGPASCWAWPPTVLFQVRHETALQPHLHLCIKCVVKNLVQPIRTGIYFSLLSCSSNEQVRTLSRRDCHVSSLNRSCGPV